MRVYLRPFDFVEWDAYKKRQRIHFGMHKLELINAVGRAPKGSAQRLFFEQVEVHFDATDRCNRIDIHGPISQFRVLLHDYPPHQTFPQWMKRFEMPMRTSLYLPYKNGAHWHVPMLGFQVLSRDKQKNIQAWDELRCIDKTLAKNQYADFEQHEAMLERMK